MTAALVAGLVAGYGVALPVGPIATYLVSLGARERPRTAAAAALGVASTDGILAAAAVIGGARVRILLRPADRPLTYASVAVLLLLALRIVVRALRQFRREGGMTGVARAPLKPLNAYATLVVLTAVNPSTLIYFSALVMGGQSGPAAADAVSKLLFAAGALLASASWQLALTSGGLLLGRVLTGRHGQLLVAAASAGIMVGLASRILAS